MQIASPFGYQEIVPFYRTQKVRLLKSGEIPEFVTNLNAIPISYTEFQPVAHHYPIVYTSGDGGANFTAVAVLGMTTGENLFYAGGTWAENTYVPAYARRYPFCMSRVTLNKIEQQDRMICIEKTHLDDDGVTMFDGEGKPTPEWIEIERLLTEFEADLDRSREMCSILADYSLLEPFTMQATLASGGGPMHLTGMHRVNEKKLEHLNASQIKNLMRKGVMSRIYLHLLALDNFNRLLDRKAARSA